MLLIIYLLIHLKLIKLAFYRYLGYSNMNHSAESAQTDQSRSTVTAVMNFRVKHFNV
jgi:hypothetical protein